MRRKVKMNKAPISEMFTSIQGEGKSLGLPSTFIRFWGCNLRCRFNGYECDTPYAVYKKDNVTDKTVYEIKTFIERMGLRNVVFTGGEPLLYQDFMIKLMNKLVGEYHYTFEIETNGTLPLKKELISFISSFNISPKLNSSNQAPEVKIERINYVALDTYPEYKSTFKFVVKSIDDMPEVLDLNKRYPKFKVYLMPMGDNRENLIKSSKEVADLCLRYKFRFSPREHIMIWNKERGV